MMLILALMLKIWSSENMEAFILVFL